MNVTLNKKIFSTSKLEPLSIQPLFSGVNVNPVFHPTNPLAQH